MHGVIFQRGEWRHIFHYRTNVTILHLLCLHDHHASHSHKLCTGPQNAWDSGKYPLICANDNFQTLGSQNARNASEYQPMCQIIRPTLQKKSLLRKLHFASCCHPVFLNYAKITKLNGSQMPFKKHQTVKYLNKNRNDRLTYNHNKSCRTNALQYNHVNWFLEISSVVSMPWKDGKLCPLYKK